MEPFLCGVKDKMPIGSREEVGESAGIGTGVFPAEYDSVMTALRPTPQCWQ
jgi:hypothetical protein